MWKESLFSLERYERSWHLFRQNVAENYRCRVILSAGNYKWQCLSFSSWNLIFTPSFSFFFLLLLTACQSILLPVFVFCQQFAMDDSGLSSTWLWCFRGKEKKKKKVCTALAFVQMFFSSCALGKHTYINSVFSKSPQHCYLFWNMLPFSSISCWPWMKVFALLNISALGKWTLTSLEQRKVSIPTFRPLFFFKRFLLLCCQVFTLIVHVSCFCKQQKCWNMCEG